MLKYQIPTMLIGAAAMLATFHTDAAAAPVLTGPRGADTPGVAQVVESYKGQAPAALEAQEAAPPAEEARPSGALGMDLARAVSLTKVPELDPGAGHSSLALLLGAVAIMFSGRRRS